jgi:hypothetical protein
MKSHHSRKLCAIRLISAKSEISSDAMVFDIAACRPQNAPKSCAHFCMAPLTRRFGEVAHLFVDAGLIAMTAFISPYWEDRRSAPALVKEDEFIEVYVKCLLEECERRDPKRMYEKARAGAIKEFTGISAPYEEPEKPGIVLETDSMNVEDCIDRILNSLVEHKFVKRSRIRQALGRR